MFPRNLVLVTGRIEIPQCNNHSAECHSVAAMDDADDPREKLKDLVARWIAADEAERAEMPDA